MSNAGMHGSRYWTDGDWEYTFLAPQGNINESDKSKLLAVLKKFDKTLYVRSDSESSGWVEVEQTIKMPELENSRGHKGWALSSGKNVLSDKNVLNELEKNLKEAGYSCSFMVIEDGPEDEIEENSDMNLETKDSGQPTLDETLQKTVEVKEKSGKGKTKKKQKSKKSTKVKVGNGTQTNTIRELKERSASAKASKDRKLTPYKVISNTNNDENKVKEAWKAIGSFIKTNAETYKDVKPVGYGDKKHWHNWHKSWVGKVFVQEDEKRFWLMKLTDDLAATLKKNLEGLGFTIEPYEDGNSKSVTPIISNESKPENPEVEPMKKPEETPKPPDAHNTSEGTQKPPVRPLPKPPNKKEEVTAASQQISENIERDEKKPLPKTSKLSTSPSKPESELKDDFLKDIRNGPKLKKTPTVTKQEINENSKNDLTSMLRKAMKVRRADITDDEEPVEGDKNHEIMNILQSKGNGIYIAKLQLTSPYKEVKEMLSAEALCPDGAGKMWLTNKEQGQYNPRSDISEKIDEQTLEKCAITKDNEPVEWYVKVLTEIESDKWEDDDDDTDFLPSVTQMEALQAMRKDVTNKGARLVSISTPSPELKPLVKNPPTLPTRRVKPDPITNEREDQTAKKGSTEKKPAKFIGLEDNVTTQGQSGRSRILVIVKYSDIEEIRKTHPTEKVRDVSKGIYKEFNPEKLAIVLDNFNKTNGVLKSLMLKGSHGFGQPNVGGYTKVLKNPVKQKYKDTRIEVSAWNLIISKPDGKPLAKNEVEKIQELVKILKDHGVAVRRAKDLKLQ